MSARLQREPSCQELVELITDYLEGRMEGADQRWLELHLRGCAGCRAYLEQMRQTLRLAGRIREESFEPRQREELLRLFRGWKKES